LGVVYFKPTKGLINWLSQIEKEYIGGGGREPFSRVGPPGQKRRKGIAASIVGKRRSENEGQD